MRVNAHASATRHVTAFLLGLFQQTKLDDVPVEFIGEELLKELKGPIKAAAKRPGRRHHAGVRTVVVFLLAMGTNDIKFPDVFPFWLAGRPATGARVVGSRDAVQRTFDYAAASLATRYLAEVRIDATAELWKWSGLPRQIKRVSIRNNFYRVRHRA